MAKRRKLAGAALAAYRRKRSKSTALTRRGSTAVKTRTRYVRVRARRRRGSVSTGAVRTLRGQLRDFIGAAAYGFATGDHGKMPQLRAYVKKIPTLDAIGAPASHGLLLHFIAGHVSGKLRMAAGHLSHAALMQAAHNLGASGVEYDKFVTMAGDDDYLSGDIDDEIGDDDLGDDDAE